MRPTDAYCRRVYLQPWGLYLISEGGTFQSFHIDASAGLIKVTFEASAGQFRSHNRLRVERPSVLESHQSFHVCVRPASAEPHREGSSPGSKEGEVCVFKGPVTSHAAGASLSSRPVVFPAEDILQSGEGPGSCVRDAQCSICTEHGRTFRLGSAASRGATNNCTSLVLALRKAGDAGLSSILAI